MISEQAKEGVEFIFMKAARSNLALGADDVVDIQPETDMAVTEFPEQTVIVLTISSFLFRLLTIFPMERIKRTCKKDYRKSKIKKILL